MKPYLPFTPPESLNLRRALALAAAGLVLGIAVGLAAYFVSQVFYLIVVFPFLVAFATVMAYATLGKKVQVQNRKVFLAVGIGVGLVVAITYMMMPYLTWRGKQIAEVQAAYNVSASRAAYAVDRLVAEDGGMPGLLGFLALNAREGFRLKNYLIVHSVAVPLLDFTFKGVTAWLYWLVEFLLIVVPVAYMCITAGNGRPLPYNRSAGGYYNSREIEIGAAPLDCRAALETALNAGDTAGVAAMLQPEGSLAHPCLEVYEQRTLGKPEGDVLLIIKQTQRIDAKTVKRRLAGRWEASAEEFKLMLSRQSAAPGNQPG